MCASDAGFLLGEIVRANSNEIAYNILQEPCIYECLHLEELWKRDLETT